MIELAKLDAAAEQLRVYDVDQDAWEHEPDGFTVNATHVLFHLAKDITTKDLGDEGTVRTAVAPDCVQYGLRLVRWTGQQARMAMPTQDQINVTSRLTEQDRFAGTPLHQVAILEAVTTIARQLHNEDHESTRWMAGTNRLHAARRASRLLVYAADLQSDEFGFDLFEAFDNRIAALRERFGVPEPAASQG